MNSSCQVGGSGERRRALPHWPHRLVLSAGGRCWEADTQPQWPPGILFTPPRRTCCAFPPDSLPFCPNSVYPSSAEVPSGSSPGNLSWSFNQWMKGSDFLSLYLFLELLRAQIGCLTARCARAQQLTPCLTGTLHPLRVSPLQFSLQTTIQLLKRLVGFDSVYEQGLFQPGSFYFV